VTRVTVPVTLEVNVDAWRSTYGYDLPDASVLHTVTLDAVAMLTEAFTLQAAGVTVVTS
jgi:hypothetical protein